MRASRYLLAGISCILLPPVAMTLYLYLSHGKPLYFPESDDFALVGSIFLGYAVPATLPGRAWIKAALFVPYAFITFFGLLFYSLGYVWALQQLYLRNSGRAAARPCEKRLI